MIQLPFVVGEKEQSVSVMSVRSIEDWIEVLKPLGYWDAAGAILDDLDDYPKTGGELRKLLNAHRDDDKKQLGNALIAWAMLTAIEPWPSVTKSARLALLKSLDQDGRASVCSSDGWRRSNGEKHEANSTDHARNRSVNRRRSYACHGSTAG